MKLLVIEAMRNTLSAVTGAFDGTSRKPVTPRAQLAVDDHAPGGARHVAIRDELLEEVVDRGEGVGEFRRRRLAAARAHLRARNGSDDDRRERQAGAEGACHARSMR